MTARHRRQPGDHVDPTLDTTHQQDRRWVSGLGRWFLVDVLGEIAFGLVAVMLLAWAWAAFSDGWSSHRGWTIAAAILLACFLGYGAWNVLTPSRQQTRFPRVAAAAAVSVVLLVGYSVSMI
ncbi:MAG: hypothetical protein HZY75_01850 [Nocardioidaceae bacterium]|nr:MAG: hypothetical protein HZY75_01850 [Nocardioidaceae bacterium]